jgi:hypothetical protein
VLPGSLLGGVAKELCLYLITVLLAVPKCKDFVSLLCIVYQAFNVCLYFKLQYW